MPSAASAFPAPALPYHERRRKLPFISANDVATFGAVVRPDAAGAQGGIGDPSASLPRSASGKTPSLPEQRWMTPGRAGVSGHSMAEAHVAATTWPAAS